MVYDGTEKTITVEATGLVEGDTCGVTPEGNVQTDAGDYTAVATKVENPNY